MKILYYLCAYGLPKLDVKENILNKNLAILSQFGDVDLYMNIYDESYPALVDPSIPIKIHRVIGGMIANMWEWDETFSNYDYIIMTLDDVEIQFDFDFKQLIDYYNDYNFDIISPSVTNASNDYMNPYISYRINSKLIITKMCELFFYVMKPPVFKKYLTIIDPINNPINWGVDLLVGFFGFKVGLYYKCIVNHYWHGVYTQDKFDMCNNYLKKYGFNDVSDMCKILGTWDKTITKLIPIV